MAGLKRVASGTGIFLTRYEPTGGPGMLVLAAKLPGRIFSVEIAPGSEHIVHRHGWLCGTPGVQPTVALQQTFGGAIFGGEGFLLQRLEGQGTAWLELSGEISTYELAAGQSLCVHPGHVGAFQATVSFQTTRLPGIANRMFGKDGHHVVVLTGPGTVWLQSMPLPILAHALSPYLGESHEERCRRRRGRRSARRHDRPEALTHCRDPHRQLAAPTSSRRLSWNGVLHEALRRGGDFAEIFAEDRSSSSIFLDDRKVEELSSGRDRGAGIRVIVGETTGFAHTADLSEKGLLSAARGGSGCRSGRWRRRPPDRAARGKHRNINRWGRPRARCPSRPRSTCCSVPTMPPARREEPSFR